MSLVYIRYTYSVLQIPEYYTLFTCRHWKQSPSPNGFEVLPVTHHDYSHRRAKIFSVVGVISQPRNAYFLGCSVDGLYLLHHLAYPLARAWIMRKETLELHEFELTVNGGHRFADGADDKPT